jgi:hypothetical protein
MGIGGLAALLFTRNFVYALGVPLIVIGYGLVEKKKWAFLSLLAALGLSTLGLISQINKAKNDADEWSTSVTPDLKNTLGWYEKEWAGIQSDPQWSNSAEEQRNEMANFYRRQRVEQDSIIAAALKTNPDLELVLNRRFSHQMAVPNGSSDNVSECLAQTDLDAIHGCMTQRLRDAITRAVLALSFSGMVVAYYWKRKDEMA